MRVDISASQWKKVENSARLSVHRHLDDRRKYFVLVFNGKTWGITRENGGIATSTFSDCDAQGMELLKEL